MELQYDDLNRLIQADEGFMVDTTLKMDQLTRVYGMDLLGNLVSGEGGFKQNSGSSTFTHAVNATNEITTLTRGNPAGQPRAFLDAFSTLDAEVWTEEGDPADWSISSNRLTVTNIDDGCPPPPAFCTSVGLAELIGPAFADDGAIEVEFEIPSGGGVMVLVFSRNADDEYWGLSVGNSGDIEIIQQASGSPFWETKASTSGTINTQTRYIARVVRNQRHVDFGVFNTNGAAVATESYDSTEDFGEGLFGLLTATENMLFDDFSFTRLDQINPAVPRWSGTANAQLASATLQVTSMDWGGEAVLEWAGDDDYIAQADVDLNSGADARLIVRYQNPDNYYAVQIGEDTGGGSGPITLIKRLKGKESTLASTTYSTASSVTLKVSLAGSTIKAWVDTTLEINTTGAEITAGGVALAGEDPKFDNVKVGYDNNADDDIDDAGDDLVVNDAFDATTVGFTYDDNGNLTDDGTYKYTYDAWNRLVKASASSDTDIVIQAARYDGLGRRVRKVVTNSGDLDGTTVYYYNGHQIVETRDGSGNLAMQVYHGTRYIDEVVGLKVADLGRVYLHQDHNYNVTAMTDLTGRVLERYYYSPYGELEAVVDAHPFDYDDDGVVDEFDLAAATSSGTCWNNYSGAGGACKRLDANADREIDADDYNAIAAYVNSLPADGDLQRTPSSPRSLRGNPFGHQGLVLDAEIGSYQNRERHYAQEIGLFLTHDPLSRRPSVRSGYRDGLSLYSSYRENPFSERDPFGLCCSRTGCSRDPWNEPPSSQCASSIDIGTVRGCGETGTCKCPDPDSACPCLRPGIQDCRTCWECSDTGGLEPRWLWTAQPLGPCLTS